MAEIRKELADAIKKRLDNPKRFRVLADEKPVARIERPVIRVSQRGFSRLPAAPYAKLNTRFNVRVTSPHADLDQAETQLNELVPDVLLAIEGMPGATWTDAEKVMDPDVERLAYDIPVTVITSRKKD